MRLKIIRSFAQLNVAILLLLIIAGFSILGTIIEQDQTIQYYQQNYSEIFSPLEKTILYTLESLLIVTSNLEDSAFTTEIPTP